MNAEVKKVINFIKDVLSTQEIEELFNKAYVDTLAKGWSSIPTHKFQFSKSPQPREREEVTTQQLAEFLESVTK